MTKPTSSSFLSLQWRRSTLRRCFIWVGRRHNLRKLLFVCVGLITLIALFYAIENWRGSRMWRQYEAKMHSRGTPITLAEIIPPEVPAEENFAATPFWTNLPFRSSEKLMPSEQNDDRWPKLFGQAYGMLQVRKKPLPRRNPYRILEFFDFPAFAFALQRIQQEVPVESYRPQELPLPTDPRARAEAAATALEALQVYQPVLDELRAASDRPDSRYPIAYNTPNPYTILLPHLAKLKSVCQLLRVRALSFLALEKPDQALEEITLMIRLADSVQSEPFLISFLVRAACLQIVSTVVWEGQVTHAWAESHLQKLQSQLQRVDLLQQAPSAMQAERVWQNVFCHYLREHQDDRTLEDLGISDASSLFPRIVWQYSPQGWFYMEQTHLNEYLDRMYVNLIHDSPDQPRIEPSAVEARIGEVVEEFTSGSLVEQVWQHRILSRLLLPALEAVYQRVTQKQALLDMAVLACALERHRLRHGNYPEELAALVPSLVNQLPNDVVSASPYRYRNAPDQEFLLYSVGWNEIDEDGKPAEDGSAAKGDWVWLFP